MCFGLIKASWIDYQLKRAATKDWNDAVKGIEKFDPATDNVEFPGLRVNATRWWPSGFFPTGGIWPDEPRAVPTAGWVNFPYPKEIEFMEACLAKASERRKKNEQGTQ